ncbi:MAG: 16S rRNA processing protein RimM [Aquificae bacterium]|nr:16S rRNA processing protein RimM [Aquificota bacterium]
MRELVAVGKVLDTFGLEGELKVRPYLPLEQFLKLERVYFKRVGGEAVPFELEELRPHDRFVVVKLKGVDGVEAAAQFKGAKVFLYDDELPPLEDEDAYYAYELVGMKVVTDKGKELGTVTRVRELGAYDALEVDDGKLLIPFVGALVLSVDRDAKKVVVKEELLPL